MPRNRERLLKMDLQEILKKQRAQGFKKPLTLSNTLSISDYLLDPDTSRPYSDEISAHKSLSLSLVKNNQAAVDSEKKNTANFDIKNTSSSVELSARKQPHFDNRKATQQLRSATQQLKRSATQELRSATQTATQQLKNNYRNAGRKKIVSYSYASLSGNERAIVDEIYIDCLKNRSLETNYIEKNQFSQRVNVKIGAIRTSCTRLRKKNILSDFIATKGRGSAWKFVLSESIYHQISVKSGQNTVPISDTNSDTTILSSSSIYKITTTKSAISDTKIKPDFAQNHAIQLPAHWKKIEYAELQKTLNLFNERFGLAQIKTIFSEAGDLISATDVQTSINNFTLGLNNFIQKPTSGIYDRKIKIATLLECLRNGETFIDPQVEAAKEAESKRTASEKRKEIQVRYFESKFEHYFTHLSDEQMIALIPMTWKNSNAAWEHAVRTNNAIVQKSYAKDFVKEYFEKNIWPEVLEKLLGME